MKEDKRTLAEFRAIRETVGMTQGMLAEELGVNPRSVRRWESPDYDGYRPPQDAWDALDAALETQRRGIAAALGKLDEIVQERGAAPDSVRLTYWVSQGACDRHHYVDDGGDWRMANATNRMLAAALHERGIEVDWTDGPREGRWVSFTGPSGVEYHQFGGTMQYRLPDTDKAICAQLRRELRREL